MNERARAVWRCWRGRTLLAGMLAMGLGAAGASGGAADETAARLTRGVRSLIADNCLACHGPDEKARKAKLRLDTKEGLYAATADHGAPVVPGSLEKSTLWQRITTADVDEVMPPPKSNKTLTAEQKELLRQWIVGGAPWQGHWAFSRPVRPRVPEVAAAGFPIRNPIDAFVLAGMRAKGLEPAAEADRRTLVRRLSLDLTGLPPTPEEVAAFLRDRSSGAYEALVRRLMGSTRYGEHRARYWLDAARYADTHGLHFDNYREIWPYRDWVIRAFNRNLPFDRFTVDQLAGDLVENPTEDQRVATGFQRCNMTTNEGGTIEEENLANYANDRVTTTGWVWLGMTLNCAACHDHKFDPLTMKDFYSMAAFFRNTKQGGLDRNWKESDLYRVVPQTEADRRRWEALPEEIAVARKALEAAGAAADRAFTNWLGQAQSSEVLGEPALGDAYLRARLTEGRGTNASATVEGRRMNLSGPIGLEWRLGGPVGAAPVLTRERSFVVGDVGDFDTGDVFSFGAWVWLPADYKGEGSVLARMEGEEGNYRGWELFVREEDFGMKLINRWANISMAVRSTDKAVKRGEWQHLFVTYDGSGRASGVRLYVNGAEAKTNRDQDRLEGSIRTRVPLRIGRREKGSVLENVAVQDVRIHRRLLTGAEVRALATAPRVGAVLAEARANPTNAIAVEALRDAYRMARQREWKRAHDRLAALEDERARIRGRSPVTLVQEEKAGSEPMAQVLFRGQYDKPRDKVTAATPAVLHAMPADAPRNRLGLARWLVAPENPLTARVTVNRFWQEVFGMGLVRTAEDFGTMGEAPSNPDLLDWLAVEFQESGWDVKHLFTLMLTSSTYRQDAAVTPEKLEKDPQNRLLSRGPRFRMDAEMLRDSALAVSGLLAGEVGGPSVRTYQPAGVWEAVAMPESNTRQYVQDHGEALYRRSLYTFWKRAAPPASMDLFNAPSRETCTVRRERTNTPLQALATLNDPQFVEASRHLAERALLRERRPEEAIQTMAQRVLARPLEPAELEIARRTWQRMSEHYEAHPEDAWRLLGVGESKPAGRLAAPRLAAMTMVANQLLNLDEALNK